MKEFDNPSRWDSAAARYEKNAHPYTARYVDAALALVPVSPGSRVLDIAAGTGALTLAAARTGAWILATDFSPGMVARIQAKGLSNVEARVMDGQALDLPDAGFDAVFSMFGVFMFPDWRKGLTEMARVTRPGGYAVVAVWQDRGAGTFMLLGKVLRELFPERELAPMPEAATVLSDLERFSQEMVEAGFHDPRVDLVTRDFELDVAALSEPDTVFSPALDWTGLTPLEKNAVVAEFLRLADGRKVLPIPSTALIATATR